MKEEIISMPENIDQYETLCYWKGIEVKKVINHQDDYVIIGVENGQNVLITKQNSIININPIVEKYSIAKVYTIKSDNKVETYEK